LRPKAARRPLNCWEFKRCGRVPDGCRRQGLAVCPATTEVDADGVNRGKNGGRVCWAIAGTLCGGRQKGTDASRLETCMSCDFCQLVLREENCDPCAAYQRLRRRR